MKHNLRAGTAFRGRFDPGNTKKINKVLAGYLAWNKDPLDKAQKLQDELDKICEVLEQDSCVIERLSTDERKRGRSPRLVQECDRDPKKNFSDN
jgi:hypothetical protein